MTTMTSLNYKGFNKYFLFVGKDGKEGNEGKDKND